MESVYLVVKKRNEVEQQRSCFTESTLQPEVESVERARRLLRTSMDMKRQSVASTWLASSLRGRVGGRWAMSL